MQWQKRNFGKRQYKIRHLDLSFDSYILKCSIVVLFTWATKTIFFACVYCMEVNMNESFGLVQFLKNPLVHFEKLTRAFFPNCTRNHTITYTKLLYEFKIENILLCMILNSLWINILKGQILHKQMQQFYIPIQLSLDLGDIERRWVRWCQTLY